MNHFKEPVELAFYLWTRLSQIGVRDLHGVPGDYNLDLLDCLSSAGIRWVGNCNELNGGYAADGYARVNGISAMITTAGVGELSAINPHAGAFAEQMSLVHIVGSPSLKIRQNDRFAVHHSVANGKWNTFSDMFGPISAAQVMLDDASKAPEQIDYALKTCWISSRPVYIDVPTDMARRTVEGEGLTRPLDLSYASNDPKREMEALTELTSRLRRSQRSCILIDMCSARQRIRKELNLLIAKFNLPTFITPLSQGTVDETLPNFGGLYAGAGSQPGVQDFVENSDLVLHIGPLDTDITTFLGSAKLAKSAVIRFHTDHLELSDMVFPLQLRGIILAMLEHLDVAGISSIKFQRPEVRNQIAVSGDSNSLITHDWLWPRVGTWLQPGDVVLTDTGTASFGIFDTKLPQDSILINISLWASIGYALPSAQGAALAAKHSDRKRRTILFQGDGSFQLTCQELSTMIKHNLKVTIFVICNGGYTIERCVHETEETYNDIAEWNYKDILRVFDAESKYSRGFQVRTRLDLENLFADTTFASFDGVQLVELYTPMLDVPKSLRCLADMLNGGQRSISTSS